MLQDASKVHVASQIVRNAADEHGGGIASIDQSTVILKSGAALIGNTAEVHGGALYVSGAMLSSGETRLYYTARQTDVFRLLSRGMRYDARLLCRR